MSQAILIDEPFEIWKEIRNLIGAHYKQPGKVEPFMAHYPNINKLYIKLAAESPEVSVEVRKLRVQREQPQKGTRPI